jgi:MFS family permease
MTIVWRFAASTVIGIVPFAMLVPVTVLALRARGHDAAAIGFFAAAPFVALLALSPLAPAVVRRLGPIPAYHLGKAVSVLGFAGFLIGDGLTTWTAANLLLGAGSALTWPVSEGLIARHAPADRRGRFTGLYQTANAAAFAAGPFVPVLLGLEARTAFLVALVLEVASWLPVLGILPDLDRDRGEGDEPAHRRFSLGRVGPLLLGAALLGGIFEMGTAAVGTLQGLANGLSPVQAALVPSVLAGASLLGQYPLGVLADRVGARPLLAACGSALFLSAVALPWADGGWFWLVAATWGGIGGGLYTLAMIHVGAVHGGSAVIAATAAVVAASTLGSAIGPILGGLALGFSPQFGLAAVLACLSAATLAALRWEPAAGHGD